MYQQPVALLGGCSVIVSTLLFILTSGTSMLAGLNIYRICATILSIMFVERGYSPSALKYPLKCLFSILNELIGTDDVVSIFQKAKRQRFCHGYALRAGVMWRNSRRPCVEAKTRCFSFLTLPGARVLM